MMKRFKNYFLYNLFTINLIYLLLSLIIYRRTSKTIPFIRLEIGVIIIALIIALAYAIYKSEKGHPIINAILAYILILPSLFIVRQNFGILLFRSITFLYIIFIIIGIIYSIALFIASKKYKKEVDDLNQLLKNNHENKEETSE